MNAEAIEPTECELDLRIAALSAAATTVAGVKYASGRIRTDTVISRADEFLKWLKK